MLYIDFATNPGKYLHEKSNLESVKKFMAYFDFIKQKSKLDMNNYEIFSIRGIGNVNGRVLIKEDILKSEVNKIIFEMLETKKDTPNKFSLSDTQKIMIENVISQRFEREKGQLENELYEAIESLKYFESETHKHLSKLAITKKKLDILKNDDNEKLFSDIEKVCSNGFFTLERAEDGVIVFTTKNPVIMKYSDVDFELEKSLNMGNFRLIYYVLDQTIKVYGLKDNVFIRGYPHPHVEGNGYVCYGNASEAIRKAFEKDDLVDIFKIIELILCNYNPDSPYVSFSEFEDKRKSKDRVLFDNTNFEAALEAFDKINSSESITEEELDLNYGF